MIKNRDQERTYLQSELARIQDQITASLRAATSPSGPNNPSSGGLDARPNPRSGAAPRRSTDSRPNSGASFGDGPVADLSDRLSCEEHDRALAMFT